MSEPTKEEFMDKKLSGMTKWELFYQLGLAFESGMFDMERAWKSLSAKEKEKMKAFYGEYTQSSKEAYKQIIFLIENMDRKPKVSREFVEKWARLIREAILEEKPINQVDKPKRLLDMMLTELDLEVEEKEGGDG